MNESIKLRDSWCVAAELDKSIDTISKLNYEIIALKEASKWKDARIQHLTEIEVKYKRALHIISKRLNEIDILKKQIKELEKIQAIEFYESRGDKVPKSA